jgi:acetoin:2,6-dichlorophenolindophenol oxidoreductase subunit beta
LIASVLCDDPVLYIDDRWLYDESEPATAPRVLDLRTQGPVRRREGHDVTLVGASYSAHLALQVAERLAALGHSCDVWDLRVLNPLDVDGINASVARTGRLCVIDGGWRTCGLAAEVSARAAESLPPEAWRAPPIRITLPDAPAPTSAVLEARYYPTVDGIVDRLITAFWSKNK